MRTEETSWDRNNANAKSLSLRLLRSTIYGLGWRYWLFFGTTILFALITLLPPQLFRFFTESAQTLSEINAQAFIYKLALFGGLIAVATLISAFGNAWFQEWLRLNLEARLRRDVMRRLHFLPLPMFDRAQRGDWLTRMTGDLNQVEFFLTESIPSQLRSTAILLGATGLFLYHTGPLALVPMGMALSLALLNLFVQKRLSPVLRELRMMHGNVFQQLIESLEGIRTIRAYSVERFVHTRFDEKLKEITSKGMRVVKYMGALLGGTQFSSQIMVTVILSAVMFSLSGAGITLHDALIYPFFIGLFFGSAQELSSAAYQWNRFFADGGRLAQLLFAEVPTSAKATGYTDFVNDVEQVKSLVIDELEIGYEQKSLTAPFRFSVNRGEILGVMGASGSGKSTLLEVLAGLRPALRGNASLKDESGKNQWATGKRIESLTLPLGICSYVEQRPYIFEGSIRENLVFGNADLYTEEQIWASLESAALAEFVRNVGGLDFVLRDRGQNLSEGQRYRLALSRALLLNRPFLVLDEPFAALDEVSINLVVQTLIEQKTHNMGIVVVTHYVPEALTFDRVHVFRDDVLESVPLETRDGQSKEARVGTDNSPIVVSLTQTQGGDNDQGDQVRGHG